MLEHVDFGVSLLIDKFEANFKRSSRQAGYWVSAAPLVVVFKNKSRIGNVAGCAGNMLLPLCGRNIFVQFTFFLSLMSFAASRKYFAVAFEN